MSARKRGRRLSFQETPNEGSSNELHAARKTIASAQEVACETAPGGPVRGSGSLKKVAIAA